MNTQRSLPNVFPLRPANMTAIVSTKNYRVLLLDGGKISYKNTYIINKKDIIASVAELIHDTQHLFFARCRGSGGNLGGNRPTVTRAVTDGSHVGIQTAALL